MGISDRPGSGDCGVRGGALGLCARTSRLGARGSVRDPARARSLGTYPRTAEAAGPCPGSVPHDPKWWIVTGPLQLPLAAMRPSPQVHSLPDAEPGGSGMAPGEMGELPGKLAPPGELGELPGGLGKALVEVGKAPGDIGPSPGEVGSSPGEIGPSPGRVGPSPGRVGRTPAALGRTPHSGCTPLPAERFQHDGPAAGLHRWTLFDS